MPHELLELDPYALTLALSCVAQADAHSAQMVQRAGTVFPVVTIGAA